MRQRLARAARAAGCAVLLAAATVGAGGPAAAGAPPAAATRGPVVLIGTGGLRWSDVDETEPALSAFQSAGASGLLAVRSVRAVACPVDGWLAVSAGRRAADAPTAQRAPAAEPACRQPTLSVPVPGGPASVPRWDSYLAQARAGPFDAHPGLLGRTLADRQLTAAAVGPGAAIALATPDGTVAHAFAGPTDGPAGSADPQLLAAGVAQALKLRPDVLVVDLGAIRDPAELLPGEPRPTGAYGASRADQVTRLDTRLGLITGILPADATVVLASLADSGGSPALRLVAATGPAPGGGRYGPALLRSDSTRQDGLGQVTDLLPTVLAALGTPRPAESVGAPLEPARAGSSILYRIRRLDDLDQAAEHVDAVVLPFFAGAVGGQALAYLIAWLLLRRRRVGGGRRGEPGDPVAAAHRARGLAWLARVAVPFGTLPAATFLVNLVPWWRAGNPTLACCLAIVPVTLGLALVAHLGPWRRSPLGVAGAAGGLSALVLGVDAATGGRLSLTCVMGGQPIVAGRFYGFSNPAFAVFATGALLLAAAVADGLLRRGRRREAALAVAAIGLLATVVDGAPQLGADFGGPPALIPAFGVLALRVAGIRVTPRRATLIAAGAAGFLVLVGVADWLRPADSRTHLGRFVQTLLDGGAWPVISRKAEQNVGILFSSWLVALLPAAVALAALVLFRPGRCGYRGLELGYRRTPVLHDLVRVWALLLLIGFVLNDSGTSIPAASGLVMLPLLISVAARALAADDAARLDERVGRARRSSRTHR